MFYCAKQQKRALLSALKNYRFNGGFPRRKRGKPHKDNVYKNKNGQINGSLFIKYTEFRFETFQPLTHRLSQKQQKNGVGHAIDHRNGHCGKH